MLRRVKHNQVVMIWERGYNVPEREQFYLDPDYDPSTDTEPLNLDQLDQIYTADNGRRIYVSYLSSRDTDSIGIEAVRKLIESISKLKEPVHELALITRQPLGAAAIDYLNGVQRSRDGSLSQIALPIASHEIQHFNEVDLAYNPTRHYLVPRHELLSEQEEKELLASNRININNLPILVYSDITTLKKGRRKGDPIVSYYRFRPNQIVRIRRSNFITETLTDEFVSYRRVWY